MGIKLFSSCKLHSIRSEFREISIHLNDLSMDELDILLRAFQPETIMAESAHETALVFDLAKRHRLNFALIQPNIDQLTDGFFTTDWARVFLLDQESLDYEAFKRVGAVEFEYDQYLEQAKKLMNNGAFH